MNRANSAKSKVPLPSVSIFLKKSSSSGWSMEPSLTVRSCGGA
jgi:hypothetical protein